MYNNTFATIKSQLLQVENPTPAVVISVDAAPVDNALHLDYLTSEVALEEPEIGSTDPNNTIDNNCMNDELHFGMPGGRGITKMKVMKAKCAMPTPPPAGDDGPWLNERFELGTSHVNGCEGEDGDDSYADEEEAESQAHDGSTQNEEAWWQSRFDLGTSNLDGYECEDGDDADADEED